MSNLTVKSLAPFVPGGRAYESSRRLFVALGFTEMWESAGYAGFRNGEAEFILQRFDDPAFASNFMVRIVVNDLDAWWNEISAKRLDEAFPGFRINPPAEFPWGREVNFIDLAGVCWHVAAG